MIVPVFSGPDRDLGKKATDVVRGRVAGAFPRSELRVISGGDLADWLRLSGFEDITSLTEGELQDIARKFRADERITGRVARAGPRIRLDAELTLIRDLRLSQPIASEGATVTEAAEAIAREAIAARRQFVSLRQCENLARDGKNDQAAAAAAAGIAAYARAVPARICLLGALVQLDAKPDTLIAVARTVLGMAPANPIALGDLAGALDAQGKGSEAAPVWVRLLATDSSNAELVARVVNALAREGNATIAQPLIDRGTDQYPDNLPLLKLRWLIHLATSDWRGAISVGEKLVARDPASQADPDFHFRLANAYKADSQPMRALATAAFGVAKFPRDAPLYIAYLQFLKAETDAALPRGLTSFPENPELHVFAAQALKAAGNATGALSETRLALAANPRLAHGYLQLAQLELDVGQIDSAYAALEQAPKAGESPAMVAQFALARGNALYKAANGTQKRDDYQRAMKFLALATRVGPTAQSRFLLGASALSVSQSAATEAPTTRSCELSKLADTSLIEAEINLMGGGSVAPDAAKQYLDYVAKLRPYITDQVKTYC